MSYADDDRIHDTPWPRDNVSYALPTFMMS
jgi:hypothetical protein